MFEQENEIKFFEEIVGETYMMDRPPHDGSHTACGTPNPPWWCDENDPGTAVSIDMYLFVLVLVAILIKVNFQFINK